MLEDGQIEPSDSAWSASTVLVTKKDGSTRFCVDYHRLNARTKKDAFPLPRIDDSLNSLSGQAWFSTLDLASGYWQVKLSENAKPKTAFATHSGLFQFAVMPFGLCNAPATFERLMSQVMRGLHWKRCLVYIDDILVFGNDFECALHNLELVLDRVAEYGLQLKSTKCNLFRMSVPFLGHIVGRAGLECDPNKLSAVTNWIPPMTTKGVSKFLGFTGYYRRFVPDYSTVAQALVHLLGKDCKFEWTTACQDAFEALRTLFIKAPVLAFPKEAVVSKLDHFIGYVWGPHFSVRTDHAALLWLTNLKNIHGMLARWLAKLQQFNFAIEHRPGTQHGNADGLSRCPQCERGSCVPTSTTHQHDPEQPYAYSGGGSSMDSKLIPLESGELCVAAIATALSDNSKQIVASQKNDKDITTVRNWISTDTFPECVKTSRLQVTN